MNAGIAGFLGGWTVLLVSSVVRGLSVEQIAEWNREGSLLADGLFSEAEASAAINSFEKVFPKHISDDWKDFGSSDDRMSFPTSDAAIDAITLHPNVIQAAVQLLNVSGSSEIRLSQSEGWAKYGSDEVLPLNEEILSDENGDCAVNSRVNQSVHSQLCRSPLYSSRLTNTDQRMHPDFPNHNLVVPSADTGQCAVSMIIYFSDSADTGGSTRVVPKSECPECYELSSPGWFPFEHTPGFGEREWFNDRHFVEEVYFRSLFPDSYSFRRESLYARERPAPFRIGSVLFYFQHAWHRGSPLKAGRVRYTMNVTYRKRQCDWITHWNAGWARSMYSDNLYLERLIAGLSVDQRNVLGFPEPGHSFWNPTTLAHTVKRYSPFGFDPTPYAEAMGV